MNNSFHMVLCCQLLILSTAKKIDIWCTDAKIGNKKLTHGVNICKCKKDDNLFLNKRNKTAPSPDNMSAYYTVKNDLKIEIHVEWKYKVSYLKYTDGFFIEINTDTSSSWSYKCNLTSLKVRKWSHIMFHYTVTSIPVQVNDELYFELFALPCYNIDEKISSVESKLKISVSADKHMETETQYVISTEQKKIHNRMPYKQDSKPSIAMMNQSNKETVRIFAMIIVLSVLVIVLSVTVVITVFIVQQERHTTSKLGFNQCRIRQILVIANSCTLSVANSIIAILQKYSVEEIKIHCNLWNVTEVGQVGIVKWIDNKLEMADIVIFLIENQIQGNNDKSDTDGKNMTHCSSVNTAINMATKMILKNEYRTANAKFIAVNFHKCKKERGVISFCTHYCLRTELNKLLKHAINYQNQSPKSLKKDQKMLQKLVSMKSLTKVLSVEMNNLDDTSHKCSARIPVILNIQQENFATIDCNV